MSQSATLPTISIVVPNYNGGRTIEATLKSLIEQGYPGLEIIVIDGGSTDDSVEIIKRYEKHLAHWESERDRGQSHAINKGFGHCSGEIVNWLCSDDQLLPGALRKIGTFFAEHPGIGLYAGATLEEYPDDPSRNRAIGPTEQGMQRLQCAMCIPQPSCFWRRKLMRRDPPLREDFHFKMDAEMFCLFIDEGASWAITDENFSRTVQDGNNKTRTADYRFYVETDKIFRWYWKGGGRSPTPTWYRMSIRPLALFVEKNPQRLGAGAARWGIRQIARLQKSWRRLGNRKTYRS